MAASSCVDGYYTSSTRSSNCLSCYLTRDFVETIDLPLPSLPEQKRIAALLNDQLAAVERARKAADDELAAINALPAALLRRAFRGEL